jgi:hypothetical protein
MRRNNPNNAHLIAALLELQLQADLISPKGAGLYITVILAHHHVQLTTATGFAKNSAL